MIRGLPGLRPIRKMLGLSLLALADLCGSHRENLSRVELGKQDCASSLVRTIAEVLCCATDDLLIPNPERLPLIRAAYLQKQADEAAREVGGGRRRGVA